MDNNSLNELLDTKKKNIKVENLSMSVGEINSMYRDSELILRPEYQRLLKWTPKQKTLFIESLLLGLPTPSVFVSVDDNGKWEIVDGLQRLSTIFDFIDGLKEEDCKQIPSYKPFKELTDDLVYLGNKDSNENNNSLDTDDNSFISKKFKDFPTKMQLELKRQRINVVILLSGTATDVKYELFQRLNEGGTPITPMEFRRAILSHHFPNFLRTIDELQRERPLTNILIDKITDISDKEYKIQGVILYFLTFYRKATEILEKSKSIKNVDAYITEYMYNINIQDADKDIEIFKEVIQKIDTLNFANPKKIFTGNSVYSDTIFGTITLGIAFNIQNLPSDDILKQKIEDLINTDDFKSFYKRGSSASSRIPKMLSFAKKYFQP